MFEELNSISTDKLSADICIIGAGAAGITLARQLGSEKARVLLVESGGFSLDRKVQNLYAGKSVGLGRKYLKSSRLRYLGGSTNHWAGFCRPLDARDFALWPLTFVEMVPYYQRAARLMGIHDPTDPEGVVDYLKQNNPDSFLFDTESFVSRVFHKNPVRLDGNFAEVWKHSIT